MNEELRDNIIELLANHHQRATFGAIAGLTGYIARGLMQNKDVNQINMFVVEKDSGLPPEVHYGPENASRSVVLKRVVFDGVNRDDYF